MTIAAGLVILAWFWVLCALMLADLEEAAREVGVGCVPPESVTTAAGANTTRSVP